MAGGITEFLLKHTGLCPVSFHMPGHKGSELYRRLGYGDFLEHIMDCDITEIPGADNLISDGRDHPGNSGKVSKTLWRQKIIFADQRHQRRADRRDPGICGAGRLADPGEKLP